MSLAVGSARRGHADTLASAELIAGAAVPVADEFHEGNIDVSPTLGLRVGLARHVPREPRAWTGIDLALRWTELREKGEGWDADRVRAVLGGRGGIHLGRATRAYTRIAAGVDFLHIDNVFGFSSDHYSLAVQFGVGALVRVGRVSLGSEVGMSTAPQPHPSLPDREHRAYDLELLFVLQAGK